MTHPPTTSPSSPAAGERIPDWAVHPDWGTQTPPPPPPEAAAPAPAPEPEAPAAAYDEPTPEDFKLTVRTLKQENFGSAGSIVTYRIEATWDAELDPDATYEVTYEVRGAEDGTITNYMTVTGSEYERDREETAMTPSSTTKPTAKVVHIEKV
jgi:hypothetical protein